MTTQKNTKGTDTAVLEPAETVQTLAQTSEATDGTDVSISAHVAEITQSEMLPDAETTPAEVEGEVEVGTKFRITVRHRPQPKLTNEEKQVATARLYNWNSTALGLVIPADRVMRAQSSTGKRTKLLLTMTIAELIATHRSKPWHVNTETGEVEAYQRSTLVRPGYVAYAIDTDDSAVDLPIIRSATIGGVSVHEDGSITLPPEPLNIVDGAHTVLTCMLALRHGLSPSAQIIVAYYPDTPITAQMQMFYYFNMSKPVKKEHTVALAAVSGTGTLAQSRMQAVLTALRKAWGFGSELSDVDSKKALPLRPFQEVLEEICKETASAIKEEPKPGQSAKDAKTIVTMPAIEYTDDDVLAGELAGYLDNVFAVIHDSLDTVDFDKDSEDVSPLAKRPYILAGITSMFPLFKDFDEEMLGEVFTTAAKTAGTPFDWLQGLARPSSSSSRGIANDVRRALGRAYVVKQKQWTLQAKAENDAARQAAQDAKGK